MDVPLIRSPLLLDHPSLSGRTVVFARLLTATWLLTGHVAILPGIGVPASTTLFLMPAFAWKVGLIYLSVVGVLVTWLTPAVRTGCALVALSIGLALLGDLSWFSNNRLLTALLLGLVALMQRPEHDRWLVWQLALVWFGAAWDKSWDPDWRSGQFLVAFVDELHLRGQLWSPGGASSHPTWLTEALFGAPRWVFRMLSLAAITLEWALFVAWLRGSWWVGPLSLGFFGGLVALTGSSMGMFVYLGLLAAVLLHARAGELRFWLVPAGLIATPLFSWPLLVGLAGFVGWRSRWPSARVR